jgi:hypothetical protein
LCLRAVALVTLAPGVYRTNLAYQRYWDGCTSLQKLTSKLTDTAVLGVTLDYKNVHAAMEELKKTGTKDKERAAEETKQKHSHFVQKFIHTISLLHAVALATLRTDYCLENLEVRDPSPVPSSSPHRDESSEVQLRCRHHAVKQQLLLLAAVLA